MHQHAWFYIPLLASPFCVEGRIIVSHFSHAPRRLLKEAHAKGSLTTSVPGDYTTVFRASELESLPLAREKTARLHALAPLVTSVPFTNARCSFGAVFFMSVSNHQCCWLPFLLDWRTMDLPGGGLVLFFICSALIGTGVEVLSLQRGAENPLKTMSTFWGPAINHHHVDPVFHALLVYVSQFTYVE